MVFERFPGRRHRRLRRTIAVGSSLLVLAGLDDGGGRGDARPERPARETFAPASSRIQRRGSRRSGSTHTAN